MGALQLLTLVVRLAIAGLAKGASAMGLPLIATPIRASLFGPKQAVVIITIPIFVANTFRQFIVVLLIVSVANLLWRTFVA